MGNCNCQEFREDAPNEVPVRGFLHRPVDSTGDCLVLAHGAGSNCDAPLLVALAEAFCSVGFTVLRCDLPFRQVRPQGPPPRGSADRDQQGLRAAAGAMRRLSSGRLFLGGHSYGGRQSSMLASEEPGVADGLLLLSYPLHPPQRPAELRTAHFPSLRIPALFVHGTHDGFGSVDELAAALRLIPARTELQPVAGAGHELLNRKNRDQLPGMIAGTLQTFAGKTTV
jgi:uncharacterized protein